jgi:hypothetical protein
VPYAGEGDARADDQIKDPPSWSSMDAAESVNETTTTTQNGTASSVVIVSLTADDATAWLASAITGGGC